MRNIRVLFLKIKVRITYYLSTKTCDFPKILISIKYVYRMYMADCWFTQKLNYRNCISVEVLWNKSRVIIRQIKWPK